MRSTILLLLVLALSWGCTARGFDRGALSEQVRGPVQIDDEDIRKALAMRPQMTSPFKVGVFLKSPEFGVRQPSWEWETSDRELVTEFGRKMEEAGHVDQFVYLSPRLVKGEDLKSIRLAGAQHGVDAVLVISGIADVDDHFNKWGLTYVLILPAAFVRGNSVDGLFMTHAGMWDVKNGFLYMSAEAEGEVNSTTAGLTIAGKKKDVVEKSKQASLNALTEQMEGHFSNLAGN